MTNHGDWDRMDGFAKATDPGPELTEAMLEEACELIASTMRGYGFAFFCWTRYLAWRVVQRVQEHGSALVPSLAELRVEFDRLQRPRMRKEYAQLFEGDKLVGQLMIERPFDARDWLPYVERVHPDDMKLGNAPVPGDSIVMVGEGFVRKQRFNLVRGRYVLEGTET